LRPARSGLSRAVRSVPWLGEAQPIGVQLGPVAAVGGGLVDKAEGDAVMLLTEQADAYCAETSAAQLPEQHFQPLLRRVKILASQVRAGTGQLHIGPLMVAGRIKQVQVHIPPHALAPRVRVIITMRAVDGRVELPVPVAADQIRAVPGFPGDTDDIRNGHTSRLTPFPTIRARSGGPRTHRTVTTAPVTRHADSDRLSPRLQTGDPRAHAH
jgi:hypothetical protein